MATISRRALATAVATRLVGISNATGYVGQIGAMNGLPGVTNTPADPPAKSPDDPRVKPYFIVFPGVGTPGAELDLGDTVVDLDWPVRVTAAGGDINDVLALVDRIHNDRLWRWTPVLPGGEVLCGPLRTPPGRRVPLLIDRGFTPVRHYAPLEYQLTAHT